RIRRLDNGGCGSTAKCIAIDLRNRRTKLSLRIPSYAMHLTPKIGQRLKSGFVVCSSKSRKSSGTFQSCSRSTRLIARQVSVKSSQKFLGSFHQSQRVSS